MERHHATERRRILRIEEGVATPTVDWLLGEEPLTIRVRPLGAPEEVATTTLRTPGDDFALAVGLLATEAGLTRADLVEVRYCGHCDAPRDYNAVTVATTRPVRLATQAHLRTASCGWCGTDELADHLRPPSAPGASQRPRMLSELTSAVTELIERQHRFARTGACHGALLVLSDGRRTFGEDVGRHNALDKAVGHAVLEGAPLAGALVVLSGRAGGDLVTKAARVGATHVVAVSGPSALAVELADAYGLTLVAFCRGERCNLYTHPEGISLPGGGTPPREQAPIGVS